MIIIFFKLKMTKKSDPSIYKANHYRLLIVFLLSGYFSDYKPFILFKKGTVSEFLS